MDFTIDPLNPVLLLFEGVYIAFALGLLLLSRRATSEWVRAGLASVGLMTLAWRLLAVVPSWWLYYADGKLGFGGQGCVALDLSCLKQAAKDTGVVIENAVVLGLFIVAFSIYQKKFPKQLAPGETKPEATGGYK